MGACRAAVSGPRGAAPGAASGVLGPSARARWGLQDVGCYGIPKTKRARASPRRSRPRQGEAVRRASTRSIFVAAATIGLLLAAGLAPLAHSSQHADADGDCAACLAHVGCAALVRDVVRIEEPARERFHALPEHDSMLHAGHGSPYSGRAPPSFPV